MEQASSDNNTTVAVVPDYQFPTLIRHSAKREET